MPKVEKTETKKRKNEKKVIPVDPTNDIKETLKGKQETLLSLKLDHRLGKLKNHNEIKQVRREVARLKTKIRLVEFLSRN